MILHHDVSIDVWRVSIEQLKEIMEKHPDGGLHPNGICYRLELLHSAGAKMTWYCDDDATKYARGLLAGEEE